MSHPLLAIVGPTGSGKSALALAIATQLDAEIVNCDSLQIYRYFDLGTAKPSPRERLEIPHHLIDIRDPDQPFSAGEYASLARAVLEQLAARNKLPIIVGGTGFYLKALLDGLFQGPTRNDALRIRLSAREEKRPGLLHRLLRRRDPAAARRIHPNDKNKLIRALEISIAAGSPLAQAYQQAGPSLEGFRPILVGLDPPRPALYQALDARCVHMFEHGLIEETKHILDLGFPPSAKPFESIGYSHVLRLLSAEFTPAQALLEMQKDTRHYAKRQRTWFKKDTRVSWIPGFGHSPQVQRNTLETLANKLAL